MNADSDRPRFKLPRRLLVDGIILLIGITLAAALRGSMLDFKSGDYRNWLFPWLEFIEKHNGFPALEFPFANYSPPYQYLLITSWYLFRGMEPVFIIKIVSILFDFALAYLVALIALQNWPRGSVAIFALLATLFYPTVFLNSALWGQADVIYTTGMIASVYYMLNERHWPALIAWGLAIAVKAQALFLAPFFLILLLYRRVDWKHFLAVPGVYMLAVLPAWFAGRPFVDTLTIYLDQAETYSELTKNAPNLYQWLPADQYELFLIPGLIVAAAVGFLFVALAYKARFKLNKGLVVELALLSCLLLPFFLPKMHDRYFYPADVFGLAFFFYYPRRFYIPLLIEMGSLMAYFPFLFSYDIIPLHYVTFFFLVAIILIVHNLGHVAWKQRTVNNI